MKRDDQLMVELIRRSAEPAFGYHLMLLRDAGYLDAHGQLTGRGQSALRVITDEELLKQCRVAADFSGAPLCMAIDLAASSRPIQSEGPATIRDEYGTIWPYS